MKHVTVETGDLVRVHRIGGNCHGIKSGTVCEVINADVWGDGGDGNSIKVRTCPDMYVEGVWNQGFQVLGDGEFKPAKQAMRKRDGYAKRRG